MFPSPCGVRRVRDFGKPWPWPLEQYTVSVPLRGKEGAGLMIAMIAIFIKFSFRPLAG